MHSYILIQSVHGVKYLDWINHWYEVPFSPVKAQSVINLKAQSVINQVKFSKCLAPKIFDSSIQTGERRELKFKEDVIRASRPHGSKAW